MDFVLKISILKFFLFFLIGQPSLPGVVRPVDEVPICLTLEEVDKIADDEVFVEDDSKGVLIVKIHKGYLASSSGLDPSPC
jgi:hypothetical protein